MTDSSEASKDGREASGDSSDFGGGLERRRQPRAVPGAGRARALWGSRALTRK